MQASQASIDRLVAYYAAMEANDTATWSSYLADDMVVHFANSPRLEGAAAFVDEVEGMLAQVESLHHDVVHAWEDEDGLLIFESIGTWTLHDGSSVSIPACSVCRVVDGKMTEQHIYVDNTPLFEALAEPQGGGT